VVGLIKLLNWGLPSIAALVVLGALLFGDSSPNNTTTQALKSAADTATPEADDTDNRSRPKKRPPSGGSTDTAAQPEPKRRKPESVLTACDANIRIKASQTTCGFAQNVFYGYWMSQEEPGVFADSPGIPAYSAAAGRTFFVDCSGASKIVCKADDGGYATFPVAAVSAYTVANAEKYAATHELGEVPPPGDSGADPIDPAPTDNSADCDPNYEGECLDPNAYDYDCEGGSGDGPEYTGRVEVVGDDPHDLDRDGDGVGCNV